MKATLAATLALATMICVASAQPPGGRRGGPGGEHRPSNAVLAAIDADGDHTISAAEIQNAVAALKKLDANGDGQLDREEIHPESADRPGRNRDRENADRGGRDRAGRGNGGDGSALVERIRRLDKNEDGKLTKAEIPERMQRLVTRFDTNQDQMLDEQELVAMAEQLSGAETGRRQPRERAGFGGPSRDGGRRGNGPDARPEGPGHGPPSPEQMIEDAFSFDANNDGLLSKSELRKFADSREHRRGPEGPGAARGQQRGGRATTRPARPE